MVFFLIFNLASAGKSIIFHKLLSNHESGCDGCITIQLISWQVASIVKTCNCLTDTSGKFRSYLIVFFFKIVTQGIVLLKPEVTPEGNDGFQKVVRLWVHEVYRVFYDRLVDSADRALFFSIIKVCEENLLYNNEFDCLFYQQKCKGQMDTGIS